MIWQRAYMFLPLALILLGTAARGEGQDRRCRYGDGSAPGCNNKEDSAAYQGDEKSKQQLTPPMMQHFQKAQEHRQQAEEARQQQDEGRAQQEDRLAEMEQMKGQQLQQQIDANKKSADQNRKSEALLANEPDESAAKAINRATQTITVDKERLAAKAGKEPTAEEPTQAPHAAEIARFDDYKAEKLALDQLIAARTFPTESKSAAPREAPQKGPELDLEPGGKRDKIALGFNDNAGVRPEGYGAGTTAPTSGSPAAANRLLGTTEDVPTNQGALGATPKNDAELAPPREGTGQANVEGLSKAPSLLTLRTGKKEKPKDGEGDDFWKKVGKKEKASARDSARSRAGKGKKGVVSVRRTAAN